MMNLNINLPAGSTAVAIIAPNEAALNILKHVTGMGTFQPLGADITTGVIFYISVSYEVQ